MKAHQSNPNAQTLELPASELQDLQAIALGLDRLKAPDLEHPKIIYLLRKRSFCSFFWKRFLAQDELLVERVVRPFDQKNNKSFYMRETWPAPHDTAPWLFHPNL